MKQTIMRTLRHGVGQARVTVLHETGNVDVVVTTEGGDDPLSDGQVIEALRNAIKAMDAIGAHIEHHVEDHGH